MLASIHLYFFFSIILNMHYFSTCIYIYMYISAQREYKQYSLFQHSENKIYPNPNLGGTDYTCTYTLITYMCTDPVTKKNVLTVLIRPIKKTDWESENYTTNKTYLNTSFRTNLPKTDRNERDRKLKIEYCEIF